MNLIGCFEKSRREEGEKEESGRDDKSRISSLMGEL